MSGPVRLWYATVYVRDFPRALAFYRDTLGLPLRFADEKFGFASFARVTRPVSRGVAHGLTGARAAR